MTNKDEEIKRLKAEVESLKSKLARDEGRPKNEEIRKAIFKMLDEGKGNSEIIGKTVKGTKISHTTFYRVKNEWKSQR